MCTELYSQPNACDYIYDLNKCMITDIAFISMINPWSLKIRLSMYTTPIRLKVVKSTVTVIIRAIFRFCIITKARRTTAIASRRFCTAIALM